MNSLESLRILAEHQQHVELKERCECVLGNDEEPQVFALLSLAHAHLGSHELALKFYEKAVEHQKDFDAYALSDLAATLIVMHRIEDAIALLQKARNLQPDYALNIGRLAYCHLLQQDHVLAKNLFLEAVALDPERLSLINNLANIELQQSEYGLAQKWVDQGQESLSKVALSLPELIFVRHQQMLGSMQLQIWIETEAFEYAENWLQQEHIKQQQTGSEEAEFIYWLVQYGRLLAERDLHAVASEILREYAATYQDNNQLCINRAELAQVQGQFQTAINLIEKALKKDEDNIALWVQLSAACLILFEAKSRWAAEKAIELSQGLMESDDQSIQMILQKKIQAKNALAHVESQAQNFELSEKLYLEILSDNKDFLPALLGLGQQHMQQGYVEDALELFEQVRTIDPVKGQCSLINVRHFPEDVKILEKMKFAAQQPSLEGTVRAGILFQLAAAWEKRGAYDTAFEFARQANDASKQFLSYDARKHRNQCGRIRMRYSKALYEHRTQCGVESSLPVYVLGMPRSGTTLVEQILAGHSQIFGAGELGVIPQLAHGLERWERHTGSGRSYPDCVDDLTADVVKGLAQNMLKELQEYDPQAKHVVDKLPHNFENIGLIKFLFPNAKIISVRRDPRDIALSNYFTDYQAKHGGMGFAYDLSDIAEQLADHNLLMHHWKQVFPDEILEINYEDVVDDLEGSARIMLDYIGVDWEAQVLKFNELERTVKTASVWQVRQPIYKTSKAKWKRYQQHLAPLIKGTNAKISPDPIEDMITLPQPGFLTQGVGFYNKNELDAAEMCFKKMLHHNPDHGACNYMLGLVCMRKKHIEDGIRHMEAALAKAPWHKEWQLNLIRAYEEIGDMDKALQIKEKYKHKAAKMKLDTDPNLKDVQEQLEFSMPSARADFTAEYN